MLVFNNTIITVTLCSESIVGFILGTMNIYYFNLVYLLGISRTGNIFS